MTAIISPNVRIRYPQWFVVGERSVVDDFCYFSTRVNVGICSHIASGCSIAGGLAHQFTLGDFSSLSSGVKVWCSSNDYANDLVVLPPPGVEIGDGPILGDVTFENYTGAGANAVVMPDNFIPEGVIIGALSFVPTAYRFEPWTVYAGIPIRPLRPRNRANVLEQAARLRKTLEAAGGEPGESPSSHQRR